MTRLLVAFVAVTLLASAGSPKRNETTCEYDGQADCKPCYRPTEDPDKKIENKSPDVTGLEVERTEVRIPLPEGSPPTYQEISNALTVSISTTAVDPEGDVLTHNYTVSGGRIIGQGPKVMWDLNKVMPGTYTITAGADDGCGICGKTITRTVAVLESENTPHCACSKITIDALHMKTRRSGPVFSVNLTGPERPGLAFNWTLSEGTILSGQGSRTITAEPSGDPRGRAVTANVEVSGLDPDCGCLKTATRTLRY